MIRLAFGMLLVEFREQGFNIELFAFPLSKIANTDLEFGPKRSQRVDMFKQFTPDFFLGRLGELGHLSERQFKCFCHCETIPQALVKLDTRICARTRQSLP